MKRSLIFLVALALCCGAATTLMAERPVPAEKADYMAAHPEAKGATAATRALETPIQTAGTKSFRAVGAIAYDDGTVTAVPTVSSFCYGNQFNTFSAGNPVMASGTVATVAFFMATGAGTDNVFLSVFGPVVGTTAPVLTSASVPATAAGAINTHVFATPIAYTGSSFLAGIWYIAGDTVGLGSGTVAGQGHHGMSINDVVGTGFAPLSSLNALVAAAGDILPVELMTFTVQ